MATLSTAARVFQITELLEAILLNLKSSDTSRRGKTYRGKKRPNASSAVKLISGAPPPPPVLQLFVLQRVNRDFQATIVGSKALQRNLTVRSTICGLPSYFDRGFWLSDFTSSMDRKISIAWEAASVCAQLVPPRDRSGSWKTMKINDRDSKECVKFVTCPKRKIRYDGGANEQYIQAELQTKPDTTLGELLDWKLSIDARTLEEQHEIVQACRIAEQQQNCVDLP